MKNLMLMALASGGILLATSSDANAQNWRGGRSSGFGVSLNFGSPGFNNINRFQNSGYGHNHGLQQNSRYRNTGFDSRRGFNNGFASPVRSYRSNLSSRSFGYSNRYVPVQRYSPQRGYGSRSCRY